MEGKKRRREEGGRRRWEGGGKEGRKREGENVALVCVPLVWSPLPVQLCSPLRQDGASRYETFSPEALCCPVESEMPHGQVQRGARDSSCQTQVWLVKDAFAFLLGFPASPQLSILGPY